MNGTSVAGGRPIGDPEAGPASRSTADDEAAEEGTTALSEAVLAAFQRGEDDGVRAVYQRYAGPVFAVAFSILGDRDLAADVVQETFVRAWRASGKYDLAQEISPWLFTIARRVAIDTWRSRRRISGAAVDDDAVVALPPELDSIWEAFQVRAAVDRLPATERAIVRLQHYQQLSHAEIAAWFGIPLGTVKSRSFRAHRRLADWLRPLHMAPATTAGAIVGRLHRAEPGAGHDDA